MAAHISVSNEQVSRPAALAFQCCRCNQRVICCPGCGEANFILVDGVSSPTGFTTNAARGRGSTGVIINGRGGAAWTRRPPAKGNGASTPALPHAVPTAFELFCRDTEVQRDVGMDENRIVEVVGGELEDESLYDRRRFHAECWLAADAETRKRYELAASALAAAITSKVHRVASRDAPGNVKKGKRRSAALESPVVATLLPCCGDVTDASPSVTTANVPSDDGKMLGAYRSPMTAFRLFCKREQHNYKTKGALMKAWRSMSLADKKPYDDEAAAIRVATRGKRSTRVCKN
ncbi:hypothetical protein C3747_80g47 [Trypanosoma cruzi]|uniref:Uncharacterized protein n=2 Tax=Trypanosoma cruzi TaxID=5693 RepID=Q4CM50_TRYCC|nr:hypothetical protein, conserved [Trypanosoma cruzi]EAN81351.1 hypothetical protein, conserved [Trypanosoma cruzi]PWV09317.1 hypothetical protein C3747_80g47 [Trypanosoma cruzi]RNC54546.1 hypothetical protein TcCL_ESM08013 [Trypanosoma cruzi]|eukprot:XP_802797.1 hypothetical protein [Trypanosoma cruzi strain CL Brener]